MTTGRSIEPGEQPRQEAQRQVVDRLEAEILERPDRRRPPGARRSAHDDDLLPCLRASCLGHLVPRAQHSVRACLSRERRGRCARKWSLRRSRFGTSRPEINSMSTPRCVIVAGCGIRAAGGRSRSTASASGASGTAGSRRIPTPRASISPASASGARASSASPAPAERHPVVGDQRRPAADQRQRQRRLAGARGAEKQHPAPADRHRRGVQRQRFCPIRPSPAGPFPSAQRESNRTPIPTGCHTGRPDFAPVGLRINPTHANETARSRVIQATAYAACCAAAARDPSGSFRSPAAGKRGTDGR